MKREEINKYFSYGDTTIVIYQTNQFMASDGMFDDIMPDEDEDSNDYTLLRPEDIDTCYYETLRDMSENIDGMTELLDSGKYGILHWRDDNTAYYVVVWDNIY